MHLYWKVVGLPWQHTRKSRQVNDPTMFAVIFIFTTSCILAGSAQDYPVRLINPYDTNSKEGRLEIQYNGVWGTVCDDAFNINSARVACASLGFGYYGTVIANRYKAGAGDILLDDVNCAGYETGIERCSHRPWGESNCDHDEAVAISCGNAQDYSVRLTNPYGNSSKEGRLEIYYSGVWGTVCSDLFTGDSAKVACNSLGFGYSGSVIGDRYGAGSGEIWLDDVNCDGSEIGIQLCLHRPWGEHNCDHTKDVSISCDCTTRYFNGSTGEISSPNYPRPYANNLNCSSYIRVDTGRKLTIAFLALSTEAANDWVTITCTSGSTYTSPQYSGTQIPTVVNITSCNTVRVHFYTDGSTTFAGFSLAYDITSDCPSNYFPGPTGQISSPNYPDEYNNYLDCSSYITISPGQRITITFLAFTTEELFDYVTITCESGSAFTSPRYSGSHIPAVIQLTSCYSVKVYFHSDRGVTFSGFNLTYDVTSECLSSHSSGFAGNISSPNYPNAYNGSLDCSSYISVQSGKKVTITFLAFNTQPSDDYVTITCDSGNVFTSTNYSGSQIPAVLTITSCTRVEVYFHTEGSTNYTGFSLTYSITPDCSRYSNFSGPTGQISSPNYPNVYDDNLDCSNYITVPSGQTIIICFLAFNTQPSLDWVQITCETGKIFQSPLYWGLEIPSVLTITSCSTVEVFFHTDSSINTIGFSLTYNITSDNINGGITTKPSNAFPRSDENDPVIFNCTSASEYLPWWTINSITLGNHTISNSTCGVISSFQYSTGFTTESLGPGSCNLILESTDYHYLLAGSFICTDSTLASARALLAPLNPQLRSMRGVNFSVPATDVIRDEELQISCDAYFIYWASDPLEFIYRLYSDGPLVQMFILRTYWTLHGNVVPSTYISNSSSSVEVKAPAGKFPPYTCNIVCDFFSNVSEISNVSPVVISVNPESIEALYWPMEESITVSGHVSGQIKVGSLLYCNVAANPPATYSWIDESNGEITKWPNITINHDGKYTCNASNIIRGQRYEASKTVVTGNEPQPQNKFGIIMGATLGSLAFIIVIILVIVLIYKCSRHILKRGVQRELRQTDHYKNCAENDGYDELNENNTDETDTSNSGGADNIYDNVDENDHREPDVANINVTTKNGYEDPDDPEQPKLDEPERPKSIHPKVADDSDYI